MELARPPQRVAALHLAAAGGLAALAAAGVLAVLLSAPAALPMPYPWERSERAALTQQQRQALYAKIGRAAKTYFLLEGRFPDRLQQLADAGLLAPADLRDPERHPLLFSAREESYSLRPLAGGKPLAAFETSEGVAGNFLLDPQLLVPAPTSAAPIVLLD